MRQSKYHRDIPNDTPVINSLDDIPEFLKEATGADLYAFVEDLWGNDTDAGRGIIMWLVEDCLEVGHPFCNSKPDFNADQISQVLKYFFAEFLAKGGGDVPRDDSMTCLGRVVKRFEDDRDDSEYPHK